MLILLFELKTKSSVAGTLQSHDKLYFLWCKLVSGDKVAKGLQTLKNKQKSAACTINSFREIKVHVLVCVTQSFTTQFLM